MAVKSEVVCGRCVELTFEVALSQKPLGEERVAGLNETAMRNMTMQRAETMADAKRRLQNHRRACAIIKAQGL